jgi:hypothetical protein
MFAKLQFNANTPIAGKIRDVVRIIHESSSGTASLNNLEFIDVGNSELITTVNSGWSLATGTLGSGAITTADSQYYLQGTCVDTNKTKYASIHASFNFTNASVTTDYTNITMVLAPVIDYGLATEQLVAGYDGTSITNGRNNGLGCEGGSGSPVIYIFATPRKLILIGSNYQNPDVLFGNLEYSETPGSTEYDFPPVCYVGLNPFRVESISFSNSNFYRGVNFWVENTGDFVAFIPQYYYGKLIGSLGGHQGMARCAVMQGDPSTNYGSFDQIVHVDDGTSTGGKTTQTNPWNGDFSMTLQHNDVSWISPKYFFGRRNWGTPIANSGKEYDINGNLRIPIIPVYMNDIISGNGVIDFSQCGIYKTVGNLGLVGDTVTLNGNTYFYYTYTGRTGALLIKKE